MWFIWMRDREGREFASLLAKYENMVSRLLLLIRWLCWVSPQVHNWSWTFNSLPFLVVIFNICQSITFWERQHGLQQRGHCHVAVYYSSLTSDTEIQCRALKDQLECILFGEIIMLRLYSPLLQWMAARTKARCASASDNIDSEIQIVGRLFLT